MQTSLGHLLFNAKAENLNWYRDLFGFLGWPVIFQGDDILGVSGPNGSSLWFNAEFTKSGNDYDGPGLNHLGLSAESIADVDATVEQIKSMGVSALFETPRHRPDFAENEESTYYQVMFESPDRILFEVVYTGPK